MYDLIIIGAGPAGMTAAIYAARKKIKFLILSLDIGGQMSWSSDVDNYGGHYVKGGSFYREAASASLAALRRPDPDIREFGIGFRVVVALISHETTSPNLEEILSMFIDYSVLVRNMSNTG